MLVNLPTWCPPKREVLSAKLAGYETALTSVLKEVKKTRAEVCSKTHISTMWRSFFNNHLHQNPGGNRQPCPKDAVKVVDGISDLVFIRFISICCSDPKNIRLSVQRPVESQADCLPVAQVQLKQSAPELFRLKRLSVYRCLAVNPMCFLRVRCVRYKFCLDDAAGRREVQFETTLHATILSKSSNDALQISVRFDIFRLAYPIDHFGIRQDFLCKVHTSHHFPSPFPPHFLYPCSW